MVSDRTRVGIIGAGAWATFNHIPILKARSDVELVVACRKGQTELQTIKKQFGFSEVTEDSEDVFEMDLDVILVSSPVAFHYDHVYGSLSSKAHVLCEKPFTISPQDAWALDRLARDMKRHLIVAYGWNYHPISIDAKRLMDDGGVGRIEHIMIAMAGEVRSLLVENVGIDFGSKVLTDPSTYNNPNLSGGGFAQAQLTHVLALALWLTGERPHKVFGMMSESNFNGLDLHNAISVRLKSGATCSISGATSASGALVSPTDAVGRHQCEIRIFGDRGQLIIDYERALLWRKLNGRLNEWFNFESKDGGYMCTGPPNAIIDLARGLTTKNDSPADVASWVVEIINAAYISSKTGTLVNLTC